MVVILLLLTQDLLGLVVGVSKQQTTDDINQAFQIKRESERLLRSALEEKVALRGYLLTEDQRFIDQYQEGRETFELSLERLSQLLAKNSSQRETLAIIETFHAEWLRKFAYPIITDNFDETILDSEESSLDTLREAVERILDYEQSIIIKQNEQIERLDRLNVLG